MRISDWSSDVCSSDLAASWLGDLFQALGEAAGVALLGAGERLEPLGDLLEALLAGGLGEARVHLGVLVGLAGDGGPEVVLGGSDGLAGDGVADLREEVEVAAGVARSEEHTSELQSLMRISY